MHCTYHLSPFEVIPRNSPALLAFSIFLLRFGFLHMIFSSKSILFYEIILNMVNLLCYSYLENCSSMVWSRSVIMLLCVNSLAILKIDWTNSVILSHIRTRQRWFGFVWEIEGSWFSGEFIFEVWDRSKESVDFWLLFKKDLMTHSWIYFSSLCSFVI